MKLEILRSLELTNQAFMKHQQFVTKKYGNCLVLNLLSVKKRGEKLLTTAFEEMIKH